MEDNARKIIRIPSRPSTLPRITKGADNVGGNRYTQLGMELIVTQISPGMARQIVKAKPADLSKRAFLEQLMSAFLTSPGPLVPSYIGKDKAILRFWVSGPVIQRLRAYADQHHTTVAVVANSAIAAEFD